MTSPSNKQLHFTAQNYSTPQTVTFSAASDEDLVHGTRIFTFRVSGVGYSISSPYKTIERDTTVGLTASGIGTSTATLGLVKPLRQPLRRVVVQAHRAHWRRHLPQRSERHDDPHSERPEHQHDLHLQGLRRDQLRQRGRYGQRDLHDAGVGVNAHRHFDDGHHGETGHSRLHRERLVLQVHVPDGRAMLQQRGYGDNHPRDRPGYKHKLYLRGVQRQRLLESAGDVKRGNHLDPVYGSFGCAKWRNNHSPAQLERVVRARRHMVLQAYHAPRK